ncbi:MAG: glycosyltransferase family 2 protein [Oscillospiraceae bacterium]|nr:glycosyltransferase family 2 protein [Oscillospiraceae bacterium]
MPKLSIIIPVYNMEKYLCKCLDSVIYNDINDYEIVIVNDGSTDTSPSICEDYAKRYPDLINYVSTPNGGLGEARNVGFRHSKGDFIFFLDSDDYLCENAVYEVLDALKDDVDILVYDFVNVTESGKVLSIDKGCNRQGSFTLAENPEFLFCPPSAWNKIWKRSMYAESGISFPGRVWFEDIHTTPKLYALAGKISYAEKAWHQYLHRDGSITKNKNPKRCIEIINALDSTLDYYRENGLFDKYHDQLEYMTIYHQLITSTTRVNLIDWKSDIQRELYDDFVRKFPNYKANPYVKAMPAKLKLLLFYIEHKMYYAFNLTMRLNEAIKNKK